MDIHMTISDCRYIDDIFMTSNEASSDIRGGLERVKTKDVNIKIEYGQLRTSIYHKSAAEPYMLPFTSDHPRHIHQKYTLCCINASSSSLFACGRFRW